MAERHIVPLRSLLGRTYQAIDGLVPGSREVVFRPAKRDTIIPDPAVHYELSHSPDCCEDVVLYDVCGDVEDLLNTPLLVAAEINSESYKDPADTPVMEVNEEGTPTKPVVEVGEPSATPREDRLVGWTFYRFVTIKGTVVLRWLGRSNGYYSVAVEFWEVRE